MAEASSAAANVAGRWSREQRLARLQRDFLATTGRDQPERRLPLVSVGDAYDVLARLAPNSVDCVVTSPPYWGLRSYGLDHNEDVLNEWLATDPQLIGRAPSPPPYDWYRKHGGVLGLEPYPDWYVSHLVEIFQRLVPSLAAGANVWVNLGDTYFARWSSIRQAGRQGLGDGERTRRRTPSGGYLHDKQLLLIPARFAIAMQDAGWILRNDLIWSKSGVPPRPEVDRLRLSHEHFFHFVQRSRGGRPVYWYDVDQAEPGRRDVVSVKAWSGLGGHSATFPTELVMPRIASSCPPGGLVLDPFCGTGSTLVAARALERRAHGIELSPSHAATARTRVRALRAVDDGRP